MASGFNGQNFAFNGYLPIEQDARLKRIKQLEQRAWNESQTQIFIETPYRNNKMLHDILSVCRPDTRVCVASNLTCPDESAVTKNVQFWKHANIELPKVPCIFLLYKGQ